MNDYIEREYEWLIRLACERGDNDAALEYTTLLRNYRKYYKVASNGI